MTERPSGCAPIQSVHPIGATSLKEFDYPDCTDQSVQPGFNRCNVVYYGNALTCNKCNGGNQLSPPA